MATMMPEFSISLTGVEANEILFDPVFMDNHNYHSLSCYLMLNKVLLKLVM